MTFFEPDTTWLNALNTTNYRTLVGIWLSVFLVIIGAAAFGWATVHAVPHCAVEPCGVSMATDHAASFAQGIYDTLCLFVGALMGIALGGYGIKRITDTDHVERKEQAKKAPITNITQERPALPPVTNITAKDQATVEVGGTVPVPVASTVKDPAEPDAQTDDERGD